MDVVSGVASLITIASLIKEIGSVIKESVQGYREAPREFQLFSNHVGLIQLELECLGRLQKDIQQKRLQFSAADVETLDTLFETVHDNIKCIHHDCNERLPKGKGLGTRLIWALSDRKSCERLLRQVQATEIALLTIIKMIDLGLWAASQVESTSRIESILQELEAVREEIRCQSAAQVCDKGKCCHVSSRPEQYQFTSSFKLSESWKDALQSNFQTGTFQNAFQKWHDFYLRLPIPTCKGNKSFVLALTYRTWLTSWTSFSILSGEIGFKNVVTRESEIVNACIKGDTLKVREMFLSGKAKPTDITINDRNLLHYATVSGSEELVRFLLSSGTPVQSLLLLDSSYWRRPNIARQFISHGARIDVFGSCGFTAAFYLFGQSRKREQQVELIEIMASNGFSNFNCQDKKGWTALHRAAAFGTAEDVRTLNRMGAALEIRTKNLSWTPVFTAACYNNLETLLEIIKIDPPDKREADLRGWTLLHVAIGAGSFDVIPELLRRGCDPEALSNATSHSVPEVFIDTAITPGDIARACGKEAYSKWREFLIDAGHAAGQEPNSIDWNVESVSTLQFGGCECCEQWNEALR